MSNERERINPVFYYWMLFWCWLCFHIYMMTPLARTHEGAYGIFKLWLLGYAGSYAYSENNTFYLCRFFYSSKDEQSRAWDRFTMIRATASE